MSIQE
jgi:hypothetical protein